MRQTRLRPPKARARTPTGNAAAPAIALRDGARAARHIRGRAPESAANPPHSARAAEKRTWRGSPRNPRDAARPRGSPLLRRSNAGSVVLPSDGSFGATHHGLQSPPQFLHGSKYAVLGCSRLALHHAADFLDAHAFELPQHEGRALGRAELVHGLPDAFADFSAQRAPFRVGVARMQRYDRL